MTSLSSRGTLTVRAAFAVPEGSTLSDPEGRFRGRVVRVFGPVASPYLSVAPRRSLSAPEALSLVGTTLWMEASRHGP